VRHAMTHAFPYRCDADAGGEQALDCLIAALGGYIKLVARSRPRARHAAKLALCGGSWGS
jgi:hypothetical protein